MSPRLPEWAVHLPARADPAGLDLLAAKSLTASWVDRWTADPGQRVLYDDREGWVTADELAARTMRVAARLAGAGLEAGDRLIVSAEASTELVVAHTAALRLGLVVVPVNRAYLEREVAHIVRDCRPAGAIVDDPQRGRWIRDASAAEPLIVTPSVDLADHADVALDAAASDDPALIAYTSGTTGAPKGAVLTHGNLLASAEALRLAWRWQPQDRLVLALPLFHMHGLGVGIHGTLTSGAGAVLRPRFDVGDVLDATRDHDASLLFGVPTMYARLAASPRVRELGRLRLCVSGSAPLPADLWHGLAAASGQRILERYGMTETVMNISNPYEGERRPGTVGFPLPGVEVRLAAGDSEILLRGPNVFAGYWERAVASAEAFDPDGWFRSGDIGSRDDDGYYRIVGRKKELIISGGFNVYPREVEDVLRAHPAVADVAVVGVPSDHWGEAVTAFVVPDGPIDIADVLRHAAHHLAAYKRPKEIHVVDALPRNALGKVLKHELR